MKGTAASGSEASGASAKAAEAAEGSEGEHRRERSDSFGAGKKAHWGGAEEPAGSHNDDEVATFEKGSWKHVEMLQSSDFDAKITFNPDKVFVVVTTTKS